MPQRRILLVLFGLLALGLSWCVATVTFGLTLLAWFAEEDRRARSLLVPGLLLFVGVGVIAVVLIARALTGNAQIQAPRHLAAESSAHPATGDDWPY